MEFQLHPQKLHLIVYLWVEGGGMKEKSLFENANWSCWRLVTLYNFNLSFTNFQIQNGETFHCLRFWNSYASKSLENEMLHLVVKGFWITPRGCGEIAILFNCVLLMKIQTMKKRVCRNATWIPHIPLCFVLYE